MTQIEVNKIITEKVLGKCWHIRSCDACLKCGVQLFVPDGKTEKGVRRFKIVGNPDFSQWSDYGPLLEKIQGEEWWENFRWITAYADTTNPTRGSLALAEFVVAHNR